MKSSTFNYQLIIALLGAVLFIPYLGAVHLFDWDEINFAECAREMLVSNNFNAVTINFEPFWEKPPLFIWMQALSMKVFGVNEFAARFPNAICGIISLIAFFNIGNKVYNKEFGLLWVLAYAGSFLPHFYFKSGIIDPWFNLLIFLSLYHLYRFTLNSKTTSLIVSGFLLGLAIITKGPVALLIVGICVIVYTILHTFPFSFKQCIIYSFAILSIGSLWFIMLILTGNTDIIYEFFIYQIRLLETRDAGHGGPFFYHWVVLLIGCFPASMFALRSFSKSKSDSNEQLLFKKWMVILFWVVLILFSIVKTKIVHYSSLCYIPLTFLAAHTLLKLINGELKWSKLTSTLLLIIASILGIVFSILPLVDKYKSLIIESDKIKDPFAVGNLQADVYWSGYESLIGIFLLLGSIIVIYMIKKKALRKGLVGLFLISLITVNMASVIIAPRIEQYSQNAAIEFFISKQNEDCYINTLGYKSYAHLFYSHKKAKNNSTDIKWLTTGKIDKPAYFVCKIHRLPNILKEHKNLIEMYRKNGFVFLKRDS